MTRADELPQLLLVDADERRPAQSGGAPLPVGESGPEGAPAPTHLWAESERPNDLARQRWAVIAPEGPAGDELLGRISRLIALRTRQQGAPVRVYRVPPGMRGDAAARWKRLVFAASERHMDDLPRYQLVLGDLDQVSIELQTIQATDGFVGRLAFDRPEHYEAYVDKLLAAEAAPAGAVRKAIFHTVHDGTAATAIGHRALVEPGAELAAQMQARRPGAFPGEVVIGGDALGPSADALLAEAGAARQGVLFTLSHGEGAPRRGWRSPAEQRARQGAMSFGRGEEPLAAEGLAGRSFAPGGVWFMLACFGAGTPAHSKYRRWLEALVARGEFSGRPEVALQSLPAPGVPPFVAALPKAALAEPQGPLAFVGHVDLAWSYAFRELDAGQAHNRPQRFVQTLASLLQGDRVGAAFRQLFRYFEQASTELTTLEEEGVDDPQRRAHLWMLRNDLAGYVLLGDPAARLPTPPAPARREPPADLRAQAGALFGFAVLPEESPARPDAAALEPAFGRLLLGEPLAEVAARHGLDPAELAALFERYREGGRAALERG